MAADAPLSNEPEYTVSEISGALKRTVEQNFSRVRVRAELGRVTFHGNGHVYLDLKDEQAVLNGVIWKTIVPRLAVRPEQGMEVIATGRLTTFPGRSQYQMIVERIEPAGVGALMALLEARRKKLAAEGLFAEERKQPLPFLPDVIGVITSPTGAVIRDIMHRLNDRFPRRVLLWPVLVQGDAAAGQVTAAVQGFNSLASDGTLPKPDVLIVARGGGSIEDLWPFNEESVVRAVAASEIPVISAIGHETDTTLIDLAADRRAPTPTAAAEMAVPVRSDLQADLLDLGRRQIRALTRLSQERRTRLDALMRALPRAGDLVAQAQQRLDYAGGRLGHALTRGALRWQGRLDVAGARLRPETMAAALDQHRDRLGDRAQRLARAGLRAPDLRAEQLTAAAARLRPETVAGALDQHRERLADHGRRLERAGMRGLQTRSERLSTLSKFLKTLSYQGTLARGFALVRDGEGVVLRSTQTAQAGQAITITLADGDVRGHIDGTGPGEDTTASKPKRKPPAGADGSSQGSLF